MDRPPHTARGDIGRRVAARRLQLDLSRQDVALRAGAAPGYIQYVEEQSATPGIGFLLRLADALETTVQELTGGTVDLPGGLGRAARGPGWPNSTRPNAGPCSVTTAWGGWR